MYNTALRIVNNRTDAEDILQEAFTDAFRQLPQFQYRSSFGAWLKQIVVFKSIAHLKTKRISLVELDFLEEKMDEEPIDETGIWYTVDLVRQALQELPDGYRTVISLYLLEGYDHEEIAGILNVSPSTVRTQYTRGKQRLLELLKKKEVYERYPF
jgi:RNA polymerase sigma factor (sigma-70 family)